MSLPLLFRDELNGFYRSRVMLVLWVGLPALSVLLYAASPSGDGIPVSAFTGLLVGTLGGVLAAAMLSVSIMSERDAHVFDLFVIRPVKRRDILLAKFLAVYGCVVVAGLLAILLGLAVDRVAFGRTAIDAGGMATSLVLVLSMMAISCATGVIIGVVSPSVLVAVILVLYGGNQLSAIVVLPVLLLSANPLFPLLPAFAITAVLLWGAVTLFNRKQL